MSSNTYEMDTAILYFSVDMEHFLFHKKIIHSPMNTHFTLCVLYPMTHKADREI